MREQESERIMIKILTQVLNTTNSVVFFLYHAAFPTFSILPLFFPESKMVQNQNFSLYNFRLYKEYMLRMLKNKSKCK